jgi:REP element-mobilizing transposase RayT
MKYNPEIHKRRSIRLKGYDYSQAGLYFITICCENRICRFGKIENNEMILNEYGIIAYNEWVKLAERFQNFELDVFQIMPNHIHAIIALNDTVRATLAVAQNDAVAPVRVSLVDTQNDAVIRAGASPAPTISDIVGAYKSLVSNACLKIYKSKNETMGKLWQRNYYEHIIRNEKAYENIANYIINNPAKWQEDKFYGQ